MKVRALEDCTVGISATEQVSLEGGELADLPPRAAKTLTRSGRALPLEDGEEVELRGRSFPQKVREAIEESGVEITPVGEDQRVRELHVRHAELRARFVEARERAESLRERLEEMKEAQTEARAASFLDGLVATTESDEPTDDDLHEARAQLEEAEQETEALRKALDRVGDELSSALAQATENEREQAMEAHETLAREALSKAREAEEALAKLTEFEDAFSSEIGARYGGATGLSIWIRDTSNRLE